MKFLQKCKHICFLIALSCTLLQSFVLAVSNTDLLRTATKDAMNYETTLDKEAGDVFDDSIGLKLDPRNPIKKVDSLLVKVTRFMLKVAVIAAVPMIIYAGIKIVMSMGDDGNMKKALTEIVHVVGGVILALLAVMIIYVIVSFTRGVKSGGLI